MWNFAKDTIIFVLLSLNERTHVYDVDFLWKKSTRENNKTLFIDKNKLKQTKRPIKKKQVDLLSSGKRDKTLTS